MRGSHSTRASTGILAAIAGLASVGLLPWLGKPVFPDEGTSLLCARLGWAALWQHSRAVDLVLLPYYSVLHPWTLLSGSIEWARFLSLLAFALTVFLVGRLGARSGGRLCGVLAAIVAGTNPLLVAAALSARPYSLSALAATASVAALLRWFAGGGSRWAWWFCVAAIVTLLLHLFAVLAPLSVLVAAIAVKPRLFRDEWRALIAPIGLVVAAALSLALLGAGQRRQIAWIPSPFQGKQLLRAVAGPASGEHDRYAILVLAVAIAAIALCLWARRRHGLRPALPDLRLLAVLLAWTALPTATLVAGSLARPIFLDRYVTASVPGLALAVALLTAWAVDGIGDRSADRSHRAVGGAVLVAVTLALYIAFSIPAAQLTYREAISDGLPGGHQAVAIGAQGRRAPGMAQQATLPKVGFHQPSGRRPAEKCCPSRYILQA